MFTKYAACVKLSKREVEKSANVALYNNLDVKTKIEFSKNNIYDANTIIRKIQEIEEYILSGTSGSKSIASAKNISYGQKRKNFVIFTKPRYTVMSSVFRKKLKQNKIKKKCR